MRHEDIWRILSLNNVSATNKTSRLLAPIFPNWLTRYTKTIQLPDHLAVNLWHVTRKKSHWKGHHFYCSMFVPVVFAIPSDINFFQNISIANKRTSIFMTHFIHNVFTNMFRPAFRTSSEWRY